MRTPKAAAASRANGARSRGPKTEEGKRRSSINALRHGLLAKGVVLDNESAGNFGLLLQQHVDKLSPTDDVEFSAIEEMVASVWRLRRIWTIETCLLNRAMAAGMSGTTIKIGEGDPADRMAAAFSALAAGPELPLLGRYEARIHRTYQRALHNLLLLQERDTDPGSEPSQVPSPDLSPRSEPSQVPSPDLSPGSAPPQVPSADLSPGSAPPQVPSPDLSPCSAPSQVPSADLSPGSAPSQVPSPDPSPRSAHPSSGAITPNVSEGDSPAESPTTPAACPEPETPEAPEVPEKGGRTPTSARVPQDPPPGSEPVIRDSKMPDPRPDAPPETPGQTGNTEQTRLRISPSESGDYTAAHPFPERRLDPHSRQALPPRHPRPLAPSRFLRSHRTRSPQTPRSPQTSGNAR